MTSAPPGTPHLPRKASREVRRQQLIEATIDTLAKRGFAGTTLADVARTAGLSGGIVNFHFETKEKLLAETLRTLAEEYRRNWQAAVSAVPPDNAAGVLDALLTADFNDTICTHRKLAAWAAFWAEAQSRPTYLEHCGNNDAAYADLLRDLVTRLNAAGDYGLDPVRVARLLDMMTDGIWFDFLTLSEPYGRSEAIAMVRAALKAFFPRHFPLSFGPEASA